VTREQFFDACRHASESAIPAISSASRHPFSSACSSPSSARCSANVLSVDEPTLNGARDRERDVAAVALERDSRAPSCCSSRTITPPSVPRWPTVVPRAYGRHYDWASFRLTIRLSCPASHCRVSRRLMWKLQK
jgi:hypothetical protein